MIIKSKKPTVYVALSGGIDSAVAAALLKERGYQITGIFLKLFRGQKEEQAKIVAKKLAIPFFVLDFKKEFKHEVIDYFLKEYKKGRTPNPCVVCNQKIKFGLLFKKVLNLGADFLATGHYVRLRRKIQNPKSKIQNYQFKLLKAKDREKDQSYFLYNLNQKQLKRILFPIGDLTKSQVRTLAKKFNLPVFENSESQEICFIRGETNDFLKQRIKKNPGKIIDVFGKVIGEHQGLFLYTIGQRKSIGIGGTGPYYVAEKDFKKNNLIVANNFKSPALFKKSLIAKNVNLISNRVGDMTLCRLLKIKAQVRYRQEAMPAEIKKTKNRNRVEVVFLKFQRAIAPGQSVVFYQGKEVLGGGVIKS